MIKRLEVAGTQRDRAEAIVDLLLQDLRNAILSRRRVVLANIMTVDSYDKKPSRYIHPRSKRVRVSKPGIALRLIVAPTLKKDLNRHVK